MTIYVVTDTLVMVTCLTAFDTLDSAIEHAVNYLNEQSDGKLVTVNGGNKRHIALVKDETGNTIHRCEIKEVQLWGC